MKPQLFQDKELGCIGSEAAFLGFRRANPERRASYLGNIDLQAVPGSLFPVILEPTVGVLTECVKRGLPELAFWHGGHLLDIREEAPFAALAEKRLKERDYPALKELNLLHIVSEILLKKTKMRSLPCHIQLEHTSFCNARCIMCDHYIAHNRGAKHLALSSVRRLEPVLPYVQLIVLHGNGEPLLNPEIMPLMQTYASYGVKISLNTNLSILNDDILTMLRSNCQSLHVSCDGCTAEQYESIRLGLKFQTLLEHLNKLEQDAPEINKVLEVVLMRRNVASAVDFVNFASEHGFRSVRFNRLGVNEWIGNRKEADLGPMALSTLNAAKERGQLLGVTVVTPSDASLCAGSDRNGGTSPQTVYDAARSEKLHRDYPQYTNTIGCTPLPDSLLTEGRPLQPHCGLCEYPFAKTYIDLAGNVSFCCPASRMPVGRISDEQPFSAIWNGPQYQILRRRFYEGNLPRLCETCFLLDTGSLQFLSDGG